MPEKAKPFVRRGRKAQGLNSKMAELPKEEYEARPAFFMNFTAQGGTMEQKAGNLITLKAFQTGSDPDERRGKLLGIQKMRQAAGRCNDR
jgi:hypothetical protein